MGKVPCGLQGFRIDVLKKRVIDETNERRDASHFLLAARLKKNTHASLVDWTWPFRQQARLFQPPNFGRHMGRGQRDMISEFANGHSVRALCVCDPHENDELAGSQTQLPAESVPAGKQTPDALHHRVNAATKFRIRSLNQEFLPGDRDGRFVSRGFRHESS
jgi:hypothetical protein